MKVVEKFYTQSGLHLASFRMQFCPILGAGRIRKILVERVELAPPKFFIHLISWEKKPRAWVLD
jgi:hypothetical protein